VRVRHVDLLARQVEHGACIDDKPRHRTQH
jgi:hypothetical protein